MTQTATIPSNIGFYCHSMIDVIKLKDVGLSPLESAVYAALVEAGPCFVAPLVRITKKHRQMVYNGLADLEKKRLVTVSRKNGKNFYAAGDFGHVAAELKRKEVLVRQLSEEIAKSRADEKEVVEVFGPGNYAEGLADFRKRAEEAGEYAVIRGESKKWFSYSRPFFDEHIEGVRRLKKLGIDIMIVFYEYERAIAQEFIGPYVKNPYICKIVPDEYRLPHSVWLAGDHVYILTPMADPLIIHVKSPALAQQYRECFWKQWKKGSLLT